jgi:hypothetical protein
MLQLRLLEPRLLLLLRPHREGHLKKIVLISALTLLTTPFLASAHEDHDNDDRDRPHRKVNATEFASAGLAAAALIGVAGYVMLRRRGLRQN